jgi:uncharacterized protein YutE (UPF0331/DUF86 family)
LKSWPPIPTSTTSSPSTSRAVQVAVGFRNIAVHSDEEIDWEIVHSICRQRLVDFEDFARSIASRSNL